MFHNNKQAAEEYFITLARRMYQRPTLERFMVHAERPDRNENETVVMHR